MSEEMYQRITRLEVLVERDAKELESLRSDIKEIKSLVQANQMILAEKKGGAKYLMVLLSTSALVGSLLTQVANWKLFNPL
jgi:hypothetical protein